MGWADNIILAMVLLGITTVIIGTIRVGGPSWLKAIIGRARENLAVAEAELMSSTSNEVCELWNGQEVVRCMGSASISEFICILPASESQDGSKTRGRNGNKNVNNANGNMNGNVNGNLSNNVGGSAIVQTISLDEDAGKNLEKIGR